MKGERHSIDDLMVLSRRGELTAADEQRLRDALESAPELRLVYEAGRAFDMEAPVVAGDDERIAAIERGVQKRRRRFASGSTHRTRRIVQAAMAAVLVAGVAIGAIEVARKEAPPPTVPIPATATATSTSTSTPTPTPTPTRHTAPRLSPQDDAPPRPEPPEPPAPRGASAHELFSAANAARVRGDIPEAIKLARMLEDRFPASGEARTAHLTLGMLYLQGGQAGPALHAFRSHAAAGAGATTPEALWGESQALRALGRTTEERTALQNLLQGFPQSAYASAAAKRLADLP